MKRFFAWAPLAPPRENLKVPLRSGSWADWAAFLFLGLGLLQVFFGLDEGPFRLLPLALGMILSGLPHGAVDHLVALGLAGRPLRLVPLLIVVLLYLLLVILVLGLWVVFPFAAALGFLIMTIYHWGKADLAFERFGRVATPQFRGRIGDGIHLVARGLIPIGLPFLAFPEQAIEFVSACVQIFSTDSFEIPMQVWRKWIFIPFAIFLFGDFWIHLRHSRLLFARRILIENGGLLAFFWCVPPLIAIGWYFAGWHGFRHILRLCHYESDDLPVDPVLEKRVRRFVWQAFPFTLAAVLMLAGLLGGLADQIPSSFEGVALYLVLVSALTFPHLLVVEWMDRREGGG
ncbi:MAG: Brp/Blh family beta-carotene 15,15'-dioxygenase [Akkermansiaceae bacterium]